MVTLVEFLLARIAEDETAAKSATQGLWHWEGDYPSGLDDVTECVHGDDWVDHGPFLMTKEEVIGMPWGHDASGFNINQQNGDHITKWQPARVLAECEAKRRIVERCDAALAGVEPGSWLALLTLSLLALPYADHPDYDEAWRP